MLRLRDKPVGQNTGGRDSLLRAPPDPSDLVCRRTSLRHPPSQQVDCFLLKGNSLHSQRSLPETCPKPDLRRILLRLLMVIILIQSTSHLLTDAILRLPVAGERRRPPADILDLVTQQTEGLTQLVRQLWTQKP